MFQFSPAGALNAQNSTEKSEAQSNPSGIQTAARRDFSEDSMKRVFLSIVVPALLVAMGFAQAPAASGNPDQINIKGCLSGSDGNYTVAENSTGKIFKITTSSNDLKAYVDQDVNLTGRKGSAENSIAVTELNMISEHCSAAAAAPAATVSTPSETVSTPPAAPAVAPAAEAPEATVSSPPETVIERPTPAAPAATASAAAVPAATASAPLETASAPPAAPAVRQTRTAARPHKPAATPAAAPAPAEPVSTPVADANRITAPVGPPPATPSAPTASASTSRSTWMLVSIIVVVLIIGAGVPVYNRSRRQKLLEETKGQNLSFTKEAKSDPGKSDTTGGHKAA
jgi:hypothetical protein